MAQSASSVDDSTSSDSSDSVISPRTLLNSISGCLKGSRTQSDPAPVRRSRRNLNLEPEFNIVDNIHQVRRVVDDNIFGSPLRQALVAAEQNFIGWNLPPMHRTPPRNQDGRQQVNVVVQQVIDQQPANPPQPPQLPPPPAYQQNHIYANIPGDDLFEVLAPGYDEFYEAPVVRQNQVMAHQPPQPRDRLALPQVLQQRLVPDLFSGTEPDESPDDFLESFEHLAMGYGWSNARKVAFFVTCLSSVAHQWYKN